MQTNLPSAEESLERADGVVQTETVLTEWKKKKSPKKMDSISDDGEIEQNQKTPPQLLNQ